MKRLRKQKLKEQSWRHWQMLARLAGERALAAEERVRVLEIQLHTLGKLAQASQAVVDGRLTRAEGGLAASVDGTTQETISVAYFPPFGPKPDRTAAPGPNERRMDRGIARGKKKSPPRGR